MDGNVLAAADDGASGISGVAVAGRLVLSAPLHLHHAAHGGTVAVLVTAAGAAAVGARLRDGAGGWGRTRPGLGNGASAARALTRCLRSFEQEVGWEIHVLGALPPAEHKEGPRSQTLHCCSL